MLVSLKSSVQEEEEQQNYDERYAFKDHQHQQYADKTHLHEQYPTRDELTTLLTTKSDITHDHKDKYLTRDEIIDLIDDDLDKTATSIGCRHRSTIYMDYLLPTVSLTQCNQ